METEMSGEEDEECGLTLPKVYRPPPRGKRVKSCTVTSELCLRLLHRAVRQHEWERAADLLTSYFQTLVARSNERRREAPEIIWRLGSEILLNHPKSTSEDVNAFHEILKSSGVKNYLLISLEQVYHLLCNGDIDEAHRVLSVAETWRSGNHSVKQMKLQKLIQAYRAVLNYRSWVDRRSVVAQKGVDFSSQCSAVQAMSSYYRQASINFQEIVQFPGVWDPFVLNYVDMLESSGEITKAKKVLNGYADNAKNPANPNAHVYLYEFMKRNGAPDESLIKVLRVLYTTTPSHQLMRTFSKLLENSGCEEDEKLALPVLFDLLDFSAWKDDVKSWRCLVKLLKKTFRRDHKTWILEAWQPRKSWWPSYHFTKFHAKKDWQKCTELSTRKAFVAGMLQGPGCVYLSAVSGSRMCERSTLNRMKEFIDQHNCEDVP